MITTHLRDIFDKISNMSYTDFVGFVNQWNVPPGSFSTLSEWIAHSHICETSNILEVACTTGFSSREIAILTQCRAHGFDISKSSVESAIKSKHQLASNLNISYEVANGYEYETNENFTHIIVGAALKFFPDAKKMIAKCRSILHKGGFILACPYFIKSPIPTNLIKQFQKIYGITPTTESYKDIMSLYKGLEIIYESRKDIIPESMDDMAHYCTSITDRVCTENNIDQQSVRELIYNRIFDIKNMANELRPYQAYSVLVLRYRPSIYPNRYIELF